jgi:hypothetical protein
MRVSFSQRSVLRPPLVTVQLQLLCPDNLLIGGLRHPWFPGRVAQFEHIAAGVEEVQFAPGKEALLTVDNGLGDADALRVEEFTGSFEHLGADCKCMVEPVILFRRAHERLFALAQ